MPSLDMQVADWVGRAHKLRRLQWGCIPRAGQTHGSVLGERAMSLCALHLHMQAASCQLPSELKLPAFMMAAEPPCLLSEGEQARKQACIRNKQ